MSLQSESGTPDIIQRLAEFADSLYKASIASPAALDWNVIPDAMAEIERLRETTLVLVGSDDDVICTIEGKDAENIIQIATQAYVMDSIRMALNSPPDG